jgi:hypothetical protein
MVPITIVNGVYKPSQMLHVWNSYLHLPHIYGSKKWLSYVGKYSSTMEHLGIYDYPLWDVVKLWLDIHLIHHFLLTIR